MYPTLRLPESKDSGALNTARAIFVDLLTIRADRSRYYYGMEAEDFSGWLLVGNEGMR